MHLRNGEREARPRVGAEGEQLRLHGLGVEVIEAAGQLYLLHFQAGALIQLVVGAQVVGVEQLVHGAAAGAAKGLVGQPQRRGRAVVAAVGAGEAGGGGFKNGRHGRGPASKPALYKAPLPAGALA